MGLWTLSLTPCPEEASKEDDAEGESEASEEGL